MSSVVAIYSPKKAVMGCDGRNINNITGEINTDNKTKIVQCENALIGITGRTDYYWKGEKRELEDILSETTIWDALTTMKIQCPEGQFTYLLIFQPFHLNYNGMDETKLKAFAVTVSGNEIKINECIEENYAICSGVLHCRDLNHEPLTNDWKMEVIKRIKYDEEKEKENKRNTVGGNIQIYEMLADGTINKI